jgi:hypothetical protein
VILADVLRSSPTIARPSWPVPPSTRTVFGVSEVEIVELTSVALTPGPCEEKNAATSAATSLRLELPATWFSRPQQVCTDVER